MIFRSLFVLRHVGGVGVQLHIPTMLHSWKKVVTLQNEKPYADHSYFIYLPVVRSKGRLVGGIYGVSMYRMHYFV